MPSAGKSASLAADMVYSAGLPSISMESDNSVSIGTSSSAVPSAVKLPSSPASATKIHKQTRDIDRHIQVGIQGTNKNEHKVTEETAYKGQMDGNRISTDQRDQIMLYMTTMSNYSNLNLTKYLISTN